MERGRRQMERRRGDEERGEERGREEVRGGERGREGEGEKDE